jgi:hypothetical protein
VRWNEALELAARRLETGDLLRLIADPDVTPNGRRILEEELSTRVELPRQRQPQAEQDSRKRSQPPPVSA